MSINGSRGRCWRRASRWSRRSRSLPVAATTRSAEAAMPTSRSPSPVRRRGRIQHLELGRLHRQGRGQHDRGVRGQVPGHHGQLHRGRQRQRRVLRQGPAPARPGRVGRPQHVRRHRLDGQADVRPRLPAGDRLRRRPERRREPAGVPAKPDVRPRAQVLDPVAERHDRTAREQEPRRPDVRVGQRPVRPAVQGQGHGAHRDARHHPADAEGGRDRPRRRDQGGVARADREAPGRPSTPASCAASPATTTSRT